MNILAFDDPEGPEMDDIRDALKTLTVKMASAFKIPVPEVEFHNGYGSTQYPSDSRYPTGRIRYGVSGAWWACMGSFGDYFDEYVRERKLGVDRETGFRALICLAAHETAHHVQDHLAPDVYPHGAEWAAFYKMILRRFLPRYDG